MCRDCLRPSKSCRRSKSKISRTDRKAQTTIGRHISNIADSTTFRQHAKVCRQQTGQPVQSQYQIIQSTPYSNLDNVPTLQLSTCILLDNETVTVGRSNSAFCTCSCLLLVEAQIMMLYVFVIALIDDHLLVHSCDAVSQNPNPCGGQSMLILAS